jgi:DNA-binding NarL/FixJ family response regulator
VDALERAGGHGHPRIVDDRSGLVSDRPRQTVVDALVVDDNEDMRRLVRLLVDLTAGTEVVAEATDGAEAIERWRAHRPDVVVLDYRLPDRNGLDVAEQILGEDPGAAIVLFSAFLDDSTLARADRLGVRECVSKDDVKRLPELVLRHGRRSPR